MDFFALLETPSTLAFRGAAEVVRTISDETVGQVYFHHSHWQAKLNNPQFKGRLVPGTQVRVVGRSGLTLLVSPLHRLP